MHDLIQGGPGPGDHQADLKDRRDQRLVRILPPLLGPGLDDDPQGIGDPSICIFDCFWIFPGFFLGSSSPTLAVSSKYTAPATTTR